MFIHLQPHSTHTSRRSRSRTYHPSFRRSASFPRHRMSLRSPGGSTQHACRPHGLPLTNLVRFDQTRGCGCGSVECLMRFLWTGRGSIWCAAVFSAGLPRASLLGQQVEARSVIELQRRNTTVVHGGVPLKQMLYQARGRTPSHRTTTAPGRQSSVVKSARPLNGRASNPLRPSRCCWEGGLAAAPPFPIGLERPG
jgi:hypothetical protein